MRPWIGSLLAIALALTPATVRGQANVRHQPFMPDGNLGPVDSLNQNGYTLDWIRLYTVDIYYDGEYHYDNPRPRARPWARLFFSGIGAWPANTRGVRQCRHQLVSRDSVALDCPRTPMGDVAIVGHWVPIPPDTTKSAADRPFFEQLALVARVVIRRGGKVVYDRVHRFEFLEGD